MPSSSTATAANTLWVNNGDNVVLSDQGVVYLYVIAAKSGFADSAVAQATFTMFPKVSAPVISPSADTFTTSATLTFACDTTGATIYYTTDGSEPDQSSLLVTAGTGTGQGSGSVVIDKPGPHIVKARAYETSMLASDVTTKAFTILRRAKDPQLTPPPDETYTGDLAVIPLCDGGDVNTGTGGDDQSADDDDYRSDDDDDAALVDDGEETSRYQSLSLSLSKPLLDTTTNSAIKKTTTTTTTLKGSYVYYTTDGINPTISVN